MPLPSWSEYKFTIKCGSFNFIFIVRKFSVEFYIILVYAESRLINQLKLIPVWPQAVQSFFTHNKYFIISKIGFDFLDAFVGQDLTELGPRFPVVLTLKQAVCSS